MKSASCLALVLCGLNLPALCGDDKRAKTEDGKEVILKDNGTWYYVGQSKKDLKATEIYRGKRGTFTLSLVPGVWKKSDTPPNLVAEVGFGHRDGDAYGMVVAERITIPLATLREAVVGNARKVGEEMKILEEGKRTVNGTEVLCLTLNLKAKGIAFTYMYYLYSGEAGSIQVCTFTGQNLFKELKPDMEAFLNGFAIVKR